MFGEYAGNTLGQILLIRGRKENLAYLSQLRLKTKKLNSQNPYFIIEDLEWASELSPPLFY